MKKVNKNATKARKKVAMSDLEPRANSQVKGGSSVERTAEISAKGSSTPQGGTPKEISLG